ncbi:hypothetical protein FJTKL_08775 [Diaporthe vaccinii]|uniref:Uncharacterized protein n=1 Tax=Diaporthe vaccinii TaxID=105482 RepID=A0ABR4EQH5_9PEZI
MKSTPEEIEAALANYRKVTAERNKRDLQIFVDAIVNADFEDEQVRDEFTDEQMHKERMGQLGELVQDDLDHLSQPTELMERYDELAASLYLDGTFGGDIDPEKRANGPKPTSKPLKPPYGKGRLKKSRRPFQSRRSSECWHDISPAFAAQACPKTIPSVVSPSLVLEPLTRFLLVC